MSEANENKYFIDGFFIKHFDIWPVGVDKNNLFYEQKVFIAYLCGSIPSPEDWSLNVEYFSKKEKIEELTVEDIEITSADIDIARVQGKDIEELKQERLSGEKIKRLSELKEKFGIREEEDNEKIEGLPEKSDQISQNQKLWDILECKGLLKKGSS